MIAAIPPGHTQNYNLGYVVGVFNAEQKTFSMRRVLPVSDCKALDKADHIANRQFFLGCVAGEKSFLRNTNKGV